MENLGTINEFYTLFWGLMTQFPYVDTRLQLYQTNGSLVHRLDKYYKEKKKTTGTWNSEEKLFISTKLEWKFRFWRFYTENSKQTTFPQPIYYLYEKMIHYRKNGDEMLCVSFKIHWENEQVRLLTQYLGWQDEIECYLFHVGTFSYILYNIT